jgi:transposase
LHRKFTSKFIKYSLEEAKKEAAFDYDSISEGCTLPESMNDLIQNEVLFKWRRYIQSKIKHKEIEHSKPPRNDTIWKKMLRDVREFYRILFRSRFSTNEFRDYEGVITTVTTFLGELGFEHNPDN